MLDANVEHVDDLRRQQQIEGIQDKYKKLDVEILPQIAFSPTVPAENTSQESTDLEGLTERQRTVQKARLEEEKRRREECLKREQENRRQLEEEAKQRQEELKRERKEEQIRELKEKSSMIRPQYQDLMAGKNHYRRYYLMQCSCSCSSHHVYCSEYRAADDDEGPAFDSLTLFSTLEDRSRVLEHYHPSYSDDRDRTNHKALRDLFSDIDSELDVKCEAALRAWTCQDASEEPKEARQEDSTGKFEPCSTFFPDCSV